MKINLVRTMELGILMLILLACVGAVSTVDLKAHLDSRNLPAASELHNRFLDYLNSPIYP